MNSRNFPGFLPESFPESASFAGGFAVTRLTAIHVHAAAGWRSCWSGNRRFRHKDGAPRGLAGLWNAWADKETGEIVESYTMPTINADDHPIMSRTHKADSKPAPNQQDKRSVVAIEASNAEAWLSGPNEAASKLVRPPDAELIDGGPSIELLR